MEYILVMWKVEYADEFREWWDTLSWDEQAVIDYGVALTEQFRPFLPLIAVW
jgi:hypothetical protein